MIHVGNHDLCVIDWDKFEDQKITTTCSCSYDRHNDKFHMRVRQEKDSSSKGSKIITFSINATDMENLLKMCKLQFESHEKATK